LVEGYVSIGFASETNAYISASLLCHFSGSALMISLRLAVSEKAAKPRISLRETLLKRFAALPFFGLGAD
jgi:hypothetical protein